jgi:benzoyl-CoA reductase/2-hydroxyglutaryl-CoA dehydratase subunit BcrC/BadD/HgdB
LGNVARPFHKAMHTTTETVPRRHVDAAKQIFEARIEILHEHIRIKQVSIEILEDALARANKRIEHLQKLLDARYA